MLSFQSVCYFYMQYIYPPHFEERGDFKSEFPSVLRSVRNSCLRNFSKNYEALLHETRCKAITLFLLPFKRKNTKRLVGDSNNTEFTHLH